jgi:hypothetical protein
VPLLDRQLGGHEGRSREGALLDHLEEVVEFVGCKRRDPEVVQNQQMELGQPLKGLGIGRFDAGDSDLL